MIVPKFQSNAHCRRHALQTGHGTWCKFCIAGSLLQYKGTGNGQCTGDQESQGVTYQ